MPQGVDRSQDSPHRHTIKHRNRRRRQNKNSKRVRVVGLINVKLLEQKIPDCEEDTENEQSRVRPEEILTENERYIDPEDLEEDNLVLWFFARGDTEFEPTYQAKLVDSFCRPTAFQELQSNGPQLSSRKVCLIDDRSNDGTVSVVLGDYEPLTVHEMYLKLMEKRFHPPSRTKASAKPNTNRRLIFITDPDRHGVAALMATATRSHVDAFKDFFYSYVAFKPQVRVFNESRGFPIFALSFHLPFYSWTLAQQEPRDRRLKQDGRPLRRVHNMSFLGGTSPEPSQKVDCLCEAQVSILIACITHGIWTGYCFVDAYYHDGRPSVDKYHQSELQMDPFTNGICDAGKPLLDPREYFLTCLECQSEVFKNEWINTAREFRQKVKAHIDEFKFDSTKSFPSTYRESRQPLDWLCQTRLILNELVMTLDTTINCWDNFASKDQFSTLYGRRCLTIIEQTFAETKNYLKELQNIRTLCDEHENMFKLHTLDMKNHAACVQAQAAESSQKAGFIQLFAVAPVILTAAILSMQEKAIPGFIGPNKLSFVLLMPVMIVLVFALSNIIDRWGKIRLFIFHCLAPHPVLEDQGVELV